MGDEPSVADLIAEAHAAHQAGDIAQMRAALAELARVNQTANNQDTVGTQSPSPLSQAGAGAIGALQGVGDLAGGAASFGFNALKGLANPLNALAGPVYLAKQGMDALRGVGSTVSNLRDVTQAYRAGDATPTQLARAWTGSSGAVLGTVGGLADATGLPALDASPRINLPSAKTIGGVALRAATSPVRSLGRAALGPLLDRLLPAASKGAAGDVLPQGLLPVGADIGTPPPNVSMRPTPPNAFDPMDIATFLRRQAPAAAPPPVPEAAPIGPTAMELAVAKKLGIPVMQVMGRLGTPQAIGGASSIPAGPPLPPAEPSAATLLSPSAPLPPSAEGLLTPTVGLTAEEAAAQQTKFARTAARAAARQAYNDAIQAGMTKAQATEIATRQAALVSFKHGIHSQNPTTLMRP